VILERDGSLSVIWRKLPGKSHSALDVPGDPQHAQGAVKLLHLLSDVEITTMGS